MIQLAKPLIGKEEVEAVSEVIYSGWVTQGKKVEEFENKFSAYTGARYSCAVSNCTTALHLALLTVGVKPNDIVITVSHSYIATANCIIHCGADPVFIDIELDTYNMSVEKLDNFITDECNQLNGQLIYNGRKVSAIIAVHQMGIPCDIVAINKIAKNNHIPLIEDAACAIGSEILINGEYQKIGNPHGDIACFSFHPRKLITTGEGGMLTTSNKEYYKRFKLLRHHGLNTSHKISDKANKFSNGQYTISGYNYKLTDIQAAMGIVQLDKLPYILERHEKLDAIYRTHLSSIPWLKLSSLNNENKWNCQSYPIRILNNAPMNRNDLMEYLYNNGINVKIGIMNAHEEAPFAYHDRPLLNSEKSLSDVILLPIYPELSEDDIIIICRCLLNI
jgi:perosamine synthetase